MKIKIGLAGVVLLLFTAFGSAFAKTQNPLQPPPPAVPIGDVEAEPLAEPTPPTIEGTGQVIDGDEIIMGDVVFKLDGIAAPLMTAPSGPEARIALQALINNQRLLCNVTDRGEDTKHLAGVCKIGDDDVAETLLAGGMAAVYRQTAFLNAEDRERAARYDAAETEARDRNLGIWSKLELKSVEQTSTLNSLLVDIDLQRSWLKQIPIIIFLAISGLIALFINSYRYRARSKSAQMDTQALLAILLGEVLAIRAAAQAAYDATASLIQDLPIPTAQLAGLALPPMTVFEANADKLATLPREVSVDMVQFHTRHKVVTKILSQASTLRCEQLRAAFQALVEAADEPMQRAEKLLD